MEIALNNSLPGITTGGTEFFVDEDGNLRTFHNKREIDFEELPEYVFNTIKGLMNKACASISEMKAFIPNYYGGYDKSIDIDENGVAGVAEYSGQSKFKFYNGNPISEAQLRVLKHIRLTDQEIGDKIFLSKFTVSRHVADMLANSGFKNRIELALWALNTGVIK